MCGFIVRIQFVQVFLGRRLFIVRPFCAQRQFLSIIMILFSFHAFLSDNFGHLGGAIGGAMMAYYFGPRLYLASLPTSMDSNAVVVVDKPIMRLPLRIESIPSKTSNRISRLVRRMQVWRFTDNLPSRPWRRSDGGDRLKRRRDYQRRQFFAPNQSIKPKLDD
jgi:hypothetical protein